MEGARKGEAPVLLLDAGNSLFSGARRDLNFASEGRLMVEAMNLMGYDAMAIGPKDVEAGLELLQERVAEAKFAVLSANLVVDGSLLARPYITVQKGSLSIAVLGLTAPDIAGADSVEVLAPVETARKYVPALREQAHLVVVLSNLGPAAEEELAQAVPGIDLIVGGGSYSPSGRVVQVGEVAMVRAGGLGEYLGITEVSFDAEGKPSRYTYESLLLGPEILDNAEMRALRTRFASEYPLR